MMLLNIFKRRRALLIMALIHLSIYLILGLFPYFFTHPSAIVPFSAQQINVQKAFQTPSWQLNNHFFGTDHLGRDVLAGVIYGCHTSLQIAFPAMIIATVIGLCLGITGGYYGNEEKVKRNALLLYTIALGLGSYYGFYLMQFSIKEAFSISFLDGLKFLFFCFGIVIAFLLSAYLLERFLEKGKTSFSMIALPLDEGVLKLTELFSSIPRLILILALTSFLRPSVGVLVSIIGFTSWTRMARLVRGEVLKTKSLPYIEAGAALGLRSHTIIVRHVFPNIMPPVAVAFTFGLASLLAVEATLSFLGIGLPPDYISWGKIIAGVRHNLSAWWLVVFPGTYLALTVLSLHYCSNYLLRKLK